MSNELLGCIQSFQATCHGPGLLHFIGHTGNLIGGVGLSRTVYIACRRLVDLRDKENTQTGICLKNYEKIVQGEEAVVDGVVDAVKNHDWSTDPTLIRFMARVTVPQRAIAV